VRRYQNWRLSGRMAGFGLPSAKKLRR
jgi:hypothetical protein